MDARPLTGAEYLESLRDGREVCIHGERVRDVTAHPAFRNPARSIARLYDTLHDPQFREVLTARDRCGILTHKFFQLSYSARELLEARDAIAFWARLTYGFMGRTPDDKASFMATLGAAPEFYEPFAENAARWYREYATRVLFLNHCLVNPPVDRTRPAHEVADVLLRVVRETDGGIVVRGAKMLATASALTHATFVAQNSASAAMLEKGKAKDYALVFIAPVDTSGQKLISRPSYELAAESPFDHPLSSRFDENDAVLVYEDAYIPWKHVLVYRDVDKAQQFYVACGFLNRYNLQASTRLGVKLDFMCGLLAKALAANGTDAFRGVHTQLGRGHRLAEPRVGHDVCSGFGPPAGTLGQRDPAAGIRGHRPVVRLQRPAQRTGAAATGPVLPRDGTARGGAHQAVQADVGRPGGPSSAAGTSCTSATTPATTNRCGWTS